MVPGTDEYVRILLLQKCPVYYRDKILKKFYTRCTRVCTKKVSPNKKMFCVRMCDKGVQEVYDNMKEKKEKQVVLCGSLTLKGDSCRNKVKEHGMKCRFHTIKEKIECDECPVCYDKLADKTFTCGHSMCTECYTAWCSKKLVPTCPMCRSNIGSSRVVSVESDTTHVSEESTNSNDINMVYNLFIDILNTELISYINSRNLEVVNQELTSYINRIDEIRT